MPLAARTREGRAATQHLVTPAGMGESFQVLIASKGIDQEKIGAFPA